MIDKTTDDFEPDEVFINGDAFYPKGYKVIETEFKALMGVWDELKKQKVFDYWANN